LDFLLKKNELNLSPPWGRSYLNQSLKLNNKMKNFWETWMHIEINCGRIRTSLNINSWQVDYGLNVCVLTKIHR
jgi:hypothetical protein